MHADFWGRQGTSSITQPPMYGHAVAELVRRGVAVPDATVARARKGLAFLLGRTARPVAGIGTIDRRSSCTRGSRAATTAPAGMRGCPDGWTFDRGKAAEGRPRRGAAIRRAITGGQPASSRWRRWGSPRSWPSTCASWPRSRATTPSSTGPSHRRLARRALAARCADLGRRGRRRSRRDRRRPHARRAAAGARRRRRRRRSTRPSPRPSTTPPSVVRSGRPASTGTSRPSTRRPTGGARPGPSSPTSCGSPRSARGRSEVAADLAARLVAGAHRSGLAEYWHPDTGEGLGAVPQSWAALAVVVGPT